MTHGRIADHRRQMGERRDRLLHGVALRDVVMRGRGPDGDGIAGHVDADHVLDLGDVDHVGRSSEALLHHREQGLAAGKEPGVRALGELRHGIVDRGCAVIVGLVHRILPQP
jgi:hypothetical protein